MFVNSLKNHKQHIDSHSHLSFLCDQNEELVDQNLEDFIYVQGGYNLSDFRIQVDFLKKLKHPIVPCLGLHPWHVNGLDPEQLIKEFLNLENEWSLFSEGLILLGETGLDSSIKNCNLENQMHSFRRHLEFSRQKGAPLVLHVVQSHGPALAELKSSGDRGIVHGFSGSTDVAESYIKKGFLISIGPNVLKDNFKKLITAVQELSIDHMTLESDWPDHQKSDESSKVSIRKVAERVAELKGLETEQVLQTCSDNFRHLLDK